MSNSYQKANRKSRIQGRLSSIVPALAVALPFAFCALPWDLFFRICTLRPLPGRRSSMPSRKAGGPIGFQGERSGAGESQLGDKLSGDGSQKNAMTKVTSGQDKIIQFAIT